jgi:hypothetical protein
MTQFMRRQLTLPALDEQFPARAFKFQDPTTPRHRQISLDDLFYEFLKVRRLRIEFDRLKKISLEAREKVIAQGEDPTPLDQAFKSLLNLMGRVAVRGNEGLKNQIVDVRALVGAYVQNLRTYDSWRPVHQTAAFQVLGRNRLLIEVFSDSPADERGVRRYLNLEIKKEQAQYRILYAMGTHTGSHESSLKTYYLSEDHPEFAEFLKQNGFESNWDELFESSGNRKMNTNFHSALHAYFKERAESKLDQLLELIETQLDEQKSLGTELLRKLEELNQ